jgi:hypothetical protein
MIVESFPSVIPNFKGCDWTLTALVKSISASLTPSGKISKDSTALARRRNDFAYIYSRQ